MRATLITTLCAAGVVSAQVPAQARRTKFKPPLEPMVPIVPASLTDFIPKVPRNVPKLKLSLEGGQLRLPSNADNIVNGSNVCKTQTDTTTIEDCEFKVETTIYCSAEDTWGGVEVTEKGSGESVKTDTTHCSGDSDCEDAMTKLASEAIAYLYKYPLGSTIGKVEDGVCSCGVTTTTQFGENFDIGLCVTFDSYKNLEAEEVNHICCHQNSSFCDGLIPLSFLQLTYPHRLFLEFSDVCVFQGILQGLRARRQG